MDKETIKKTAIKWLDDGVNSMAMRRWVNNLNSHMQWDVDMRSEGKNPDRMSRNKTFQAKREGMSVIIDVYLGEWMDRQGLPNAYKYRQEVFTMAHQLLTGKEKLEDGD